MTNAIITLDKQLPELAAQLEAEQALVKAVRADEKPRIHLWRAQQCLVVTKPESRLPHFEQAKQALSEQAWPIVVRETGGAAVPQSPDTLNISMAYKVKAGSRSFDIEASYEKLCRPIIEALKSLNIHAEATEVAGSFCDGKYNLAVQDKGQTKKIVGTSQKWSADKIVLSHAVILTNIDTDQATQMINQFYRLAGSDEQKSAAVVCSLQKHLGTNEDMTDKLSEALLSACESLTFA